MTWIRSRPWIARATLLLGLLAVAHLIKASWPIENTLVVRIQPSSGRVRTVELTVADGQGEVVSSIVWRNLDVTRQSLSHRVSVPQGIYLVHVRAERSDRPVALLDKDHAEHWTWMGGEHHVELEGGDKTFPLPDE